MKEHIANKYKTICSLGLSIALLIALSAGSHASETVQGAKKDFAEFKKEMSIKLDSMEKKIIELKEKTKKQGDKTHDQTVHELEEARDKVRAELNELKDDGKDGWQKFKKSLADSAESLNAKIQKALNK